MEELRGHHLHGFRTQPDLVQSWAIPGHLNGKQCLALMANPELFMQQLPDDQDESRPDFAHYLVPVHQYVAAQQQQQLGAPVGQADWAGYAAGNKRSKEWAMGILKCNEQILLPRYEVTGAIRKRRRILLPEEIAAELGVPEDTVVLQYVKYPLMSHQEKSQRLAAEAAGELPPGGGGGGRGRGRGGRGGGRGGGGRCRLCGSMLRLDG